MHAGDRVRVVLSGIYEASFENSIFYEPEHRDCAFDVQPVTPVDFSTRIENDSGFQGLVKRDHRATVTFEGVLEGSRPAKPDDLSLPVMLAYMNRIIGCRYGHMDAFRTRLMVERILSASPVPAGTLRIGEWASPRRPAQLITGARLPKYPEAAQKAEISGVVLVEIHVEKGRVLATEAVAGDRLLSVAALENIRTWEFEPTVTARFTTRFDFELERRLTDSDQNPRIELHLPEYVKVVAAENGW